MSKKKAVAENAVENPLSKLGDQENAKLRKLLKAKDAGAVTTACTMLESLHATAADFADVFSSTVLGQLVNSWDSDVWTAVINGLKNQPGPKQAFELLAAERFKKLSIEKQKSFLLSVLESLEPALLHPLMAMTNKEVYGPRFELEITTLSDKAAEALVKYQGNLVFHRLTTLSDKAAETLANHQGNLDLSGLTTLSDKVAEALASHRGELNLRGLTTLSDKAAESLAKHQGNLSLYRLTTLSDKAAEALANHQGSLDLRGLTTLSDTPGHLALARKLAMQGGDLLSLDSLTTLSDAAVEALAKHQGSLDLRGLTTLSDNAAEALANHQGNLVLHGLTTLSDKAAEALAKREGKLYLPRQLERRLATARTRLNL